MTETISIIVFLSTLFVLLGLGVWVGAALLSTAILGMWLFTSAPIGDSMAVTIWGGQSSWTLTALPLFIWMGEILFRTKLSETLFKGLAPFVSRFPGGLLHVNVAASAVFAAISGSSAATVATVGKMSIPELRARQYPEKMIIGTLSGAGTLGLLIPPSISMIIFGVTVNESISKLFMASMIPGICLALFFMIYIVGWSLLNKKTFNPLVDNQDDVSFGKRLADLIPVLGLIGGVIGSIYSGLATATEAAALGVLGAIIISIIQRSFTLSNFMESIMGSIRTTAMIMLILMGASFLSLAMGFTGIPKALAEVIGEWNLSPFALIAMLTVFYIVLGMFLDGLSSIVLTMAVIEPLVRAAGFDMLWFGVYLMIVVEMAQITPPIGFNLFVLQGMTGKDMAFISKASFPMFIVMGIFIIFLVMFPGLATWLPELLSK